MTLTSSAGRVEILNGAPIYFEVHGCGEPLLLLHGFSGCSQDWSALIGAQTHSTGEEFQLIIPDMRGHGRSFAPREGGLAGTEGAQPHSASSLRHPSGPAGVAVPAEFSAWRHDEAAVDMLALLDYLGIEPFKGIGVSAGGNGTGNRAIEPMDRSQRGARPRPWRAVAGVSENRGSVPTRITGMTCSIECPAAAQLM